MFNQFYTSLSHIYFWSLVIIIILMKNGCKLIYILWLVKLFIWYKMNYDNITSDDVYIFTTIVIYIFMKLFTTQISMIYLL